MYLNSLISKLSHHHNQTVKMQRNGSAIIICFALDFGSEVFIKGPLILGWLVSWMVERCLMPEKWRQQHCQRTAARFRSTLGG